LGGSVQAYQGLRVPGGSIGNVILDTTIAKKPDGRSKGMISVLILTRNEEQDLPGCLDSVSWSDDVHVLDSLSTDQTAQIARKAGARVTERKFDNWAAHQNWALKHIPFKHPWVLYVDADERVSEPLRRSIEASLRLDSDFSAYRIRRRDFYTNGTWLKHAQMTPFYVRLFRPQRIRYERLVNPVTVVDGEIAELDGYLDHYPFSKGIGFWLQRHIQYADFEARMVLENGTATPSLLRALFGRSYEERRRHQKQLFYRAPFRPLIKFCYMLLWRRAFMDGRAGITYAFLQSIYEYFIVLKTRELAAKTTASALACPQSEAMVQKPALNGFDRANADAAALETRPLLGPDGRTSARSQ
jgi:glycosyltransferase involved in cell wall biosynthesis